MADWLWLAVFIGTVFSYLVGMATGWTIGWTVADREVEAMFEDHELDTTP